MKSKKLIIGYAIAVFVLVLIITFNAVCSIKQFDVRFATGSADASLSAEKIQERLNVYLDKSYLFFQKDNVYGIVDSVCEEDGTYLKVTSVEKNFPNRITVYVEEEYEQFAFYSESENKYYVTDKDGKILAVKDSAASNLVGGADNLTVRGFTYPGAEVGDTIASDQSEMFALLLTLLADADEMLGGARGRFTEVEYISRNGFDFFCFHMTEGLEIWLVDVNNSASHAEECFVAALQKYTELSDAEKTYGYLQPVYVESAGGVGPVQHYSGTYRP